MRSPPAWGGQGGGGEDIFGDGVNFLVLLKPIPCYIFQQKDLWS